MENRAKSKDLVNVLYLNRCQSVILTVICAFVTFYIYMWGLIDLEDFNCLLPTTYFYNVTNDSLVPNYVENVFLGNQEKSDIQILIRFWAHDGSQI